MPLFATAQTDNHDCPGVLPSDCKEFEEYAAVDVGPLWNSTDCYMIIKYKYRLCFAQNSYLFEVIKNPQEEYSFLDQDCETKFKEFVTGNLSNSILFDIFLSQVLLENTAQIITETFGQSLIDKYNCQTGTSILAGTYYYGFCAQKWWGIKQVAVDKKGLTTYKFVEYNVACGANCCFRYQEFCLDPSSVPGTTVVNINSDPVISSSLPGTSCQQPTNGVPNIPGVKWLSNTDCISVCEEGVGKVIKSNQNQYTTKRILKNMSIDNNDEIIADIISENQSFVINFKSDFTGNISIFDLSGKHITSENFVQVKGRYLIDGLNLVNGMYIVRFETNDKTFVKKVIYNN